MAKGKQNNLSGYNLFVREYHSKHKSDSNVDLTHISALWAQKSSKFKAKYIAQAKRLRDKELKLAVNKQQKPSLKGKGSINGFILYRNELKDKLEDTNVGSLITFSKYAANK